MCQKQNRIFRRFLFLFLPFIFCLCFLVVEARGKERPYSRSNSHHENRISAPFRHVYNLAPSLNFLILRRWKNPDVIWYFPHNDEYSARANTYWAYRHFGGFALFFINHSNNYGRNFSFIYSPDGKKFFLDPNRMFEPIGISSNLLLLNSGDYIKQNIQKLTTYTWENIGKRARRILLKYWTKNRPLLALHNNRYLNIVQYRKDRKNFSVAEFRHSPTSTFVFVLSKKAFQKLKACKVNTIYQKISQKDGSLSDFAITHNLPYINIETRINYPSEQKQIINRVVYSLYPKLFAKKNFFKTSPCS